MMNVVCLQSSTYPGSTSVVHKIHKRKSSHFIPFPMLSTSTSVVVQRFTDHPQPLHPVFAVINSSSLASSFFQLFDQQNPFLPTYYLFYLLLYMRSFIVYLNDYYYHHSLFICIFLYIFVPGSTGQRHLISNVLIR